MVTGYWEVEETGTQWYTGQLEAGGCGPLSRSGGGGGRTLPRIGCRRTGQAAHLAHSAMSEPSAFCGLTTILEILMAS